MRNSRDRQSTLLSYSRDNLISNTALALRTRAVYPILDSKIPAGVPTVLQILDINLAIDLPRVIFFSVVTQCIIHSLFIYCIDK